MIMINVDISPGMRVSGCDGLEHTLYVHCKSNANG